MTPKQERFVEEYLVDLNATQAAIRAGYSSKSADAEGSRLLGNVKISEAIAEKRADLSERTAISQEKVLAEYARIGFASVSDFVMASKDQTTKIDLSALTPDQWAAIQAVEIDGEGKIKVKQHDKLRALDSISKHLGFEAPAKLAITDTEGKDLAENPVEAARVVAFMFAQANAAAGNSSSD